MRNKLYSHINNLLLPCLLFSVATGFFSAVLITVFKIFAERTVHTSLLIYDAVRSHPIWLPVLIIGAAVIGLLASLLLSISHSCRGGGIPTSVAAIRGVFSFKWASGILILPISALLSFLVGLPLGTEGPCVQMGTAVGDGVVKSLGGKSKHKAWRRYIMTGGASAGFSIATASPISAIVFSMEEIHKHFSPILLCVVSISVAAAQITSKALATMGIGDGKFFEIPEIVSLPFASFFAPAIIGIVTGISSIFFTRLYHWANEMMRLVLKKVSVKILLPVLFALVAIVGFFYADFLGSGHSIVESLFDPKASWYLLILLFLARAIGMMICNTSGATGGVFLPTLAFGAILGSLCANVMISLGWIGAEHYLLMVVLGIASFLGSTSRIPLTACVFAIEALGGINNLLPIVIATTCSLLIIEASGLEDLTDMIINAKIPSITKGKKAFSIEVPLTVKENAFVAGKELHDVLWPNSCTVVSFNRANKHTHGISEGDIITVHYTTYDREVSVKELVELVGEQNEDTVEIMMAEK